MIYARSLMEDRHVHLKSAEEIEKMREANRIVAEILAGLKGKVRPGVTTEELDRYAEGPLLKMVIY